MMTNTTPTNDKVATAATQEEILPLSSLTLIGTLLAPKGPRALLRQSAGGVKQVSPGDRIGGHTVTAIEDGTILLTRSGQSQSLSIPGQ